jgi:CRISPR/Cas system-associated protein Csm6
MEKESVEEFLARGGQITQVPHGVSGLDVTDMAWKLGGIRTLSNLSSPDKKEKKTRKRASYQQEYLAFMQAHPGTKPAAVAVSLGWTINRVRDARKGCIKAGLMKPARQAE